MVDVRRAYRRWFWRRMSWMLPGLCVSVTVAGRLATTRDLELWLRLPALVISSGVALLFVGLALLPFFVLRAKLGGDGRRAQSLRREFDSYPALALVALSLSLILLAVPLLFTPRPSASSASGTSLAAGPRHHGRTIPAPDAPAPTIAVEPEPPAAPIPPAPIPAPPPAPEAVPPAVEPAPPDLPPSVNPIPPALPPAGLAATATVDLPAGQELFSLRSRPDVEDGFFSPSTTASLKRLDRAGLPGEGDLEGLQNPEFQLDVTVLPQSRGWYGAIYEAAIDVPVGHNDSLRSGLFVASLNDEQDGMDLEASVVWQRVTVDYERRLLGYTRRSTFDLAMRVGLAMDRVNTHEASIHVNSVLRPSPWVGLEAAIWEQDGLGLVIQAGHSFALRLNGAAISSTDLKVELRIDVTETFSFEFGWHYTAVRIHDKGSPDGLAYQELEQSFSGPVGGFSLRF